MEAIIVSFEEYLREAAPKIESFHPHLESAFWEMVAIGGKRFRPRLLFSVVDAINPLLLPSSFPVALAIECIHTYSLIHDDLPAMDNASLRRGHPTLHTSYDYVTGILVGDALNSYAFELISRAPLDNGVKVELIRELACGCGIAGMVLGQALDCHFEKQKLPFEKLKFIHLHKTGKLIAASLKMGAIIVGLQEKEQSGLYEFGLKLGLLFQINDDIIDATQDSAKSGKDSGKDGDKNSYVNLLGLDGAMKQKEILSDELKEMYSLFDTRLQTPLNNTLQRAG